MKKAIQRFIRDDKGNAKVVLIDAMTLQPVVNPAEYDIINQTELPYWEPVQDVATPDVPSKVQPPAAQLNKYIQQSGGDPNHPAVKSAVSTHAATMQPSNQPTVTSAASNVTSQPKASVGAAPASIGVNPDASVSQADIQKAETSVPSVPDSVGSPAPSVEAPAPSTPAPDPAPTGIASSTRSRSPNPNSVAPDPSAPAGKVDVNGDVNPLGVGSAPKASFYNPGQEVGLDPSMRSALDKTVAAVGNLGITSGYRSPEHNKAVGGVKGSLHMQGKAVDIDMTGMNDKQRQGLVRTLEDQNVGGLITYDKSPNMLHVDMRPRNPAEAPHFMHNKTAAQMAKAPGWFQNEKAGAATRAYLGASPDELSNPGVPQARPAQPGDTSTVAQGIIGAAKDVTALATQASIQGDSSNVSPAQMAGMGLMTHPRTPSEISRMAAAFAGELSPASLEGLQNGDEAARKELAGMISTAENRAVNAKSFDAVFDPGQYNSMMASNASVTKGNYAKYGPALREAVAGFYTGALKPESYDPTSYYNPEISNPGWGIMNTGPYGLKDAQQVGDHTFGSVRDRGYHTTDLSGGTNRPTEGPGHFGLGGLGSGLNSPSEGETHFGGSGLGNPGISGDREGKTSGPGLGLGGKSTVDHSVSDGNKDKDRSGVDGGKSQGPSGGGYGGWGGPH